MTKLILQIYEVLKAHKMLRWSSLCMMTTILLLLLLGQSYKEDISDFLPLDNVQQQAFREYQETSSARRIYVIFQSSDSTLQSAVDLFCEKMDRSEVEYKTADDPEVLQENLNVLYGRIPFVLTSEDYDRIDSLLTTPEYITQQLERDKQMLMLPTAGMMTMQIQHDPLNLFLPVIERLKPTIDSHSSVLFIDSPYGSSETEHNAQLVAMLQNECDSVNSLYPSVAAHLTGGPVIAVGNAQQIKTDSMISITLAVVLIMLLLWLAFRNVRNLLLIVLSIGWGWLFAMGCLTLVHNHVSIIIIGISSVILGIAANYPLHLIAHLPQTTDVRSALKEIVMPLVVGNITTVGAFLALVPMESVALRDLGLFSAFLLIGAILFVLLWLPHMACRPPEATHRFLDKIGEVQLEDKPWIVWTVVAVTIVLSYFSFQTSFDSDLRNINYMTKEQKRDMQYLEQVSIVNAQSSNLAQWNEWRVHKGDSICLQLKNVVAAAGFADDSFVDFYHLIATTPPEEGQTLSSAIISNLTDNFNYIGWTCSLIVFFFLWFSLGNIELALLSFLPMAVSWIWILGIMSLFGIQFNVVNIILATFIFGQGDDYTIFMTEGCQFEYSYRRKMLSSYRHSIIISALIMFIGLGSLIIAEHPALYSLAEVTIVGMFSVVLMAYLFPPLIFRWLVENKQGLRIRPITLRNIFFKPQKDDYVHFVKDCYRYKGVEIYTSVKRRLKQYKSDLQSLVERPDNTAVAIINNGWGECALLVSLMYPETDVYAFSDNEEQQVVARYSAEHIAPRLKVELKKDTEQIEMLYHKYKEVRMVVIEPSDTDLEIYGKFNPRIISQNS